MLRSFLLVLVLAAVAVQAQPSPPPLPGRQGNNNFMAAGSGGGLQSALLQNALASQMFAAQPAAAFNQPMLSQPMMQQQPQLLGANPFLNVPSAGAFPNVNLQPSIPALGSVGSVAFQQPLGASPMNFPITATQPVMSMPLGMGAFTSAPITGTVPPVLPQNFGMPAATYGVLPQPILSQAQAEQLLPMSQLQQALNQRVQTLAAQPIVSPTFASPITTTMPFGVGGIATHTAIPQTVF